MNETKWYNGFLGRHGTTKYWWSFWAWKGVQRVAGCLLPVAVATRPYARWCGLFSLYLYIFDISHWESVVCISLAIKIPARFVYVVLVHLYNRMVQQPVPLVLASELLVHCPKLSTPCLIPRFPPTSFIPLRDVARNLSQQTPSSASSCHIYSCCSFCCRHHPSTNASATSLCIATPLSYHHH